jgi:hypothetical protein
VPLAPLLGRASVAGALMLLDMSIPLEKW